MRPSHWFGCSLALLLFACATPEEQAQEKIDQGLAVMDSAPAEAIGLMEQAIALDPARNDVLPTVALLQFRRGAFEEARTAARAAMNSGAEAEFDLLLIEGRSSAELGDAANAALQLRGAAELDATHPELWLEVGAALDSAGDTDGAIEAYERGAAEGVEPALAHRRLISLRLPVFEAKVLEALGPQTENDEADEDEESPAPNISLMMALGADRRSLTTSFGVLGTDEGADPGDTALEQRFSAACNRLDEHARNNSERGLLGVLAQMGSLRFQTRISPLAENRPMGLDALLGETNAFDESLVGHAADIQVGARGLIGPAGVDDLGGLARGGGGTAMYGLGGLQARGDGAQEGRPPVRTIAPRMTFAPTVITGELTEPTVRRVIRSSARRYRMCYERLLRRDPTATGDVSVVIRVQPSGSVESATARTATDALQQTATCVGAASQRLRFPEVPGGGPVTIIQTLRFEPVAD